MFYSKFVYVKKGQLAQVWIAAHWERKLKRQMVLDTDINLSVHLMMEQPLALRLSGQLLLGLVRIYQKKVQYLQADASDALTKMKIYVSRRKPVTTDEKSTVARRDAITYTEDPAMMLSVELPSLPELGDLDLVGLLDESLPFAGVTPARAISLSEELSQTLSQRKHLATPESISIRRTPLLLRTGSRDEAGRRLSASRKLSFDQKEDLESLGTPQVGRDEAVDITQLGGGDFDISYDLDIKESPFSAKRTPASRPMQLEEEFELELAPPESLSTSGVSGFEGEAFPAVELEEGAVSTEEPEIPVEEKVPAEEKKAEKKERAKRKAAVPVDYHEKDAEGFAVPRPKRVRKKKTAVLQEDNVTEIASKTINEALNDTSDIIGRRKTLLDDLIRKDNILALMEEEEEKKKTGYIPSPRKSAIEEALDRPLAFGVGPGLQDLDLDQSIRSVAPQLLTPFKRAPEKKLSAAERKRRSLLDLSLESSLGEISPQVGRDESASELEAPMTPRTPFDTSMLPPSETKMPAAQSFLDESDVFAGDEGMGLDLSSSFASKESFEMPETPKKAHVGGPTALREDLLMDSDLQKGNWSVRTDKVLQILNDQFKKTDSLTWDTIAENASRKVAAASFFEILALRSADIIAVEQQRAYGDIEIRRGPTWDSAQQQRAKFAQEAASPAKPSPRKVVAKKSTKKRA